MKLTTIAVFALLSTANAFAAEATQRPKEPTNPRTAPVQQGIITANHACGKRGCNIRCFDRIPENIDNLDETWTYFQDAKFVQEVYYNTGHRAIVMRKFNKELHRIMLSDAMHCQITNIIDTKSNSF